ncbi:titin-like [Drosophila novamexicana]|uniref:titin-like n=1 Tax=Drosophila novamexicana TaxID=47314 RepID=UPI0011E5B588|nr:titin-like [Drosophila novamexicana]XP_030568965.1 titin-like [Drosophila novamexicana]XP_030568966.1 titin-like [Drosophila novamexicana]XP_030568967.1 titin-like [Drosophila novamexicana]XP_030568968.1 titin-like [Drosophila novamexicana]XP_030568969.1 titin-like [Drosophila novamexicana]XP_030568970.1 titin-like [Drosophila novamexicana]
MALTHKSGSKQFVKNVMVMKKDTCSVRELLNWVNAEMQCDVRELSELKTGGVYCQFVHKLFPAEISLTKVYLYTNASYEIEANFKLLRNTFAKLNIRKDVPNRELAKGRGHYEFLNWLHKFHKMNHNGRAYDASKERRGKPIGLKKIVEAERRFDYAAYLRQSSTIVASVHPRKPVELVPRAHSLIGISVKPDNLASWKLNPMPDKSKAKAKGSTQSILGRKSAQSAGKSVKTICEPVNPSNEPGESVPSQPDRSDESRQSTPESLPSVPLKQGYPKRIQSPGRETDPESDPDSSNPEPHPAVPSKRPSYKRSHSTAKQLPPEPIQAANESLHSTPERISAVPSKRASYKRNQSPALEPLDAWFEPLESPLKRVNYRRAQSPDKSISPEPLEPDPEQTNYKQSRSTTDLANPESKLEPHPTVRVGHKPKPSAAPETLRAWFEPLETTAEPLSSVPSACVSYKKNKSPEDPDPETVPSTVSKQINYKSVNYQRIQLPVQESGPEPFESCCQFCELTPESVTPVPARRVNYKRVQSPAKTVAPEEPLAGYEAAREIPPEPQPELLKRVKHKSSRSAAREKAPESLQAWFEPLETTPEQLSSVPLKGVNHNRETAPEPTQARGSESMPGPTSKRVNYKRVQSPAKTVPSQTPEARYEPARHIEPELPDAHSTSVPLKRVKDKRIQSAAKVAQKTSQTDQEALQSATEPLSTVPARRIVPEIVPESQTVHDPVQTETEPLAALPSRRLNSKPIQEVAPKPSKASYEPRQSEWDPASVGKSVKPICELARLSTEPVKESTLEPLKRVIYKRIQSPGRSIVPEPCDPYRKPVEPTPKPITAVASKRAIVKRIQSPAKTVPPDLPQAGSERESTPEPHPAVLPQRLISKPISTTCEASHEPLQAKRNPFPDPSIPSTTREIALKSTQADFESLPDPLTQRANIKPIQETAEELPQADDAQRQWEAEPLPDPPEQRLSNKPNASTSTEIGRRAYQETLRSEPEPLPDPPSERVSNKPIPSTSRNKAPESAEEPFHSEAEPPLADPPSERAGNNPNPPQSQEIAAESSQADEETLPSKPDPSIDEPRHLASSLAVLKVGQSVVRAYCEESGCVALPSDSDSEDEKDDHIWDVRRQIVLLRNKLTTIETILLKYSASSRLSVKKLKRYLRKQQVDEPFVLGNF